MAYMAHLSSNQHLTVVNQEMQTVITVTSNSPGQQQSQSSSLTTGNWIKSPQLFKTRSGFILQFNGDRGQHFVLIQATGIRTITAPVLEDAVKIDLEKTADSTANQNEVKFEPMPPMKMGNMSMNMNPMSMQIGDMFMTMGQKTGQKTKFPSQKHFCTQCGQKIQSGDRFCASCGHQLDN
jgi:hypothetical protein